MDDNAAPRRWTRLELLRAGLASLGALLLARLLSRTSRRRGPGAREPRRWEAARSWRLPDGVIEAEREA